MGSITSHDALNLNLLSPIFHLVGSWSRGAMLWRCTLLALATCSVQFNFSIGARQHLLWGPRGSETTVSVRQFLYFSLYNLCIFKVRLIYITVCSLHSPSASRQVAATQEANAHLQPMGCHRLAGNNTLCLGTLLWAQILTSTFLFGADFVRFLIQFRTEIQLFCFLVVFCVNIWKEKCFWHPPGVQVLDLWQGSCFVSFNLELRCFDRNENTKDQKGNISWVHLLPK